MPNPKKIAEVVTTRVKKERGKEIKDMQDKIKKEKMSKKAKK